VTGGKKSRFIKGIGGRGWPAKKKEHVQRNTGVSNRKKKKQKMEQNWAKRSKGLVREEARFI